MRRVAGVLREMAAQPCGGQVFDRPKRGTTVALQKGSRAAALFAAPQCSFLPRMLYAAWKGSVPAAMVLGLKLYFLHFCETLWKKVLNLVFRPFSLGPCCSPVQWCHNQRCYLVLKVSVTTHPSHMVPRGCYMAAAVCIAVMLKAAKGIPFPAVSD